MSKFDGSLWREIMDYLRRHHATACRQWFEELQPLRVESGQLLVRAESPVHQNYLQRQCRALFMEAAQHVTGALVTVEFVTGEIRKPPVSADAGEAHPLPQDASKHAPETAGSPPSFPSAAETPSATATPVVVSSASSHGFGSTGSSGMDGHSRRASEWDDDGEIVLSPDYRFETFVTGPNNQVAYAASIAVADRPGEAYNPLFIHGGVGLGKTHLLQAICQQILEHRPDARICYLSCEAFRNQFLNCVQAGKMNEFRNRYRHVDVLVIDDIHFLAHQERTQEEFFHTFNALYQSNRQIVVSSDSPPADIPELEERLVSRFVWGLVQRVNKPSFETRVAILRAKAELRGIEIPPDVVEFIAQRMDTNARELEGAINTIQGHAALSQTPITLELARVALNDTTAPIQRHVNLQQIIDPVTKFYNVKTSDLQSKRRHKSITGPRQICMWLARKRTRLSLEEIGGYFGGRDHTTVMHSIRIVDERISADNEFAGEVEQLDAAIASGQ